MSLTRVLLVDDEPLVLIGMQSMLDWQALGFEIIGTARNGAEALKIVEEQSPDIVVSDIQMPLMDGLSLAEACRRRDPALPAFIMLTSYEEFDYVKRSMGFGAVEYLVKMELTADSLTAALNRARDQVEKERALRHPASQPESGMELYRDRFFLQLFGGMFRDRKTLDAHSAELGLHFDAPCYTLAIVALQHKDLQTEQLATLSASVTRMAADVLGKFCPCTVTGVDLRHFSVLFPLESDQNISGQLQELLQRTSKILYNYFSARLYWAVGRPVTDILDIPKSHRSAFAVLQLLSDVEPIGFPDEAGRSGLDHRAQVVAQVQEYIRQNLDKRLSLNDVASVFNFSPNYLSQLFAQSGETGFVEYVTDARVIAAKELMATTDLKIYEISERVGFESAFYFSKVFKKIEGVSPKRYMQRLRGGTDARDADTDARTEDENADTTS